MTTKPVAEIVADQYKDDCRLVFGYLPSWREHSNSSIFKSVANALDGLFAELTRLREEDEMLKKLVFDIANDGYLYFGPEGMTDTQEACYKIAEEVRKSHDHEK